MNPFLREHAGPLVGSTTLHIALVAAAILATWWQFTPKVTPPAAIQAYLAAPAPVHRAPPAAETAAPAPPPAVAAIQPPPQPAPPPVAAPAKPDPEIALRAEAARLAADRAAAQKRAAEDAERARAEARRQAEATLAERRADEARRKAAAAAEAAKRADDAQRAQRESDLAKQLAAEDHRRGAEDSGLQARYASELQAAIERAWNRPPTARPGLKCTVLVSQVPGGTVTDVRLGECNGDAAVRQSIIIAVHNASPLPAPPDPSLFERNLKLVFAPDD